MTRWSSLLKHFALAFLGLTLVIAGAEAVVTSGLFFARQFGISEFVIGLTLVAIGTTLPDKVISIAGALKGRSGVVTANAIGSNIFNLLAVLGLAALIRPLPADSVTLGFDVPFLIGITGLLTLGFFFRKRLFRVEGAILLALYAFYLWYNFAVK